MHDSEADKLRRAADDSRQLLVKSMSHLMSASTLSSPDSIISDSDIEKFDRTLFNQSVRQHLVFNEASYPREQVVRTALS